MQKTFAEHLAAHPLATKSDEVPLESPEESTWKPREVKERVTLWDSGVITIKIPTSAELINADELSITYLRFARQVKGGLVNFFVRGDNLEEFTGEKVTARPEVKKKIFTDGQAYLYVDLYPLEDTSADCRLIVVAGEIPTTIKDVAEPSVFKTPAPLEGAIIVGYLS